MPLFFIVLGIPVALFVAGPTLLFVLMMETCRARREDAFTGSGDSRRAGFLRFARAA